MNSIGTLLKAAEYLERREREAEHGYASSLPVPVRSSSRRKTAPKQRKSQGSRSSHNELEKNRRAQLRYFLDQLKQIVPLAPDSSRHTTLRLLTEARSLVKLLEEEDRHQRRSRDRLLREQKSLRLRLARSMTGGAYRPRVEHSLSECSSASSGSTGSFLSTGDEADMTSNSSSGFSDSEELSGSIRSTLSELAIAGSVLVDPSEL